MPLRIVSFSTAFLLGWSFSADLPAQTSQDVVRGQALAAAPNGETYAIPGAAAQLFPADAEDGAEPAARADADGEGRFSFPRPAEGCYVIRTTSAGLAGQSDPFCLPWAGEPKEIKVLMTVQAIQESVDVTATRPEIDPTRTSASGTVESQEIIDAPKINERFEDVMPLLPGVMRGPDGLINMKGARAAQSGSMVNSANVSDPVTGQAAINLPLDVVSSVDVLSNPFDAQYGRFAGAVSQVNTATSNFDKFKFTVQNFLPRARRLDGDIVGIESATPRFTVTGPIVKGKVAVTQSFEYRFVRTELERSGLPQLERDVWLESLDSFTEVDLRLGEKHSSNVTLAFYPQKQNFFGLDAFTTQQASPNLRQRGYMVSAQDNYSFNSGALLISQVSFKDLDADVKANSFDPFVVGIETARGGFFNRQDRETFRTEVSEIYNFAPTQAAGSHLFKVGFNFERNTYDGRQIFDTANFVGIDDRPALRIDFTDPTFVEANQNQFSFFAQDKWNPHRRLTLDLGFRVDRDTIADEFNVSPRAGLAYLLTNDGRTVLRGGAGFFYDRVNLNVPTFLDLPERTETRFGPSGEITRINPYRHRVREDFQNPRSFAFQVQLDREIFQDFFLRTGYQQRTTTRSFLIQPESTLEGDFLTLGNDGRDRYREFEVTGRYRLGSTSHMTISYVRSQSIGDLNDVTSFFGAAPAALIRPNERSRLPFDAPNRFLFWADLRLPGDVSIAPVLDIRSGFPFSIVDEQRDFIGRRNRDGRFPQFSTFDLQVLKGIKIPIMGKKRRVQVGVRMFNLFNSFNPTNLQNNVASPNFGHFLTFRNREIRTKFVLDF